MHLCLIWKYCILYLILYKILNSENCKHELCKIKNNNQKFVFSPLFPAFKKKAAQSHHICTTLSFYMLWKIMQESQRPENLLIKAQILKNHTFLISKIENFWLYISGTSIWKTIVIVFELWGCCFPVKNTAKTEQWGSS